MKTFKIIFYLSSLLSVTACSATSDFHLPFAAIAGSQHTTAVKDGTNNEPVTGKHCRSISTFPFFWKVNMNEAIQQAFTKRRGIVALEDVTVTQRVQFYVVFSNVCTEVVGQPLYAQTHADEL